MCWRITVLTERFVRQNRDYRECLIPSRNRLAIEAATRSRRRRLCPSGARATPSYVKESDEEATKRGE